MTQIEQQIRQKLDEVAADQYTASIAYKNKAAAAIAAIFEAQAKRIADLEEANRDYFNARTVPLLKPKNERIKELEQQLQEAKGEGMSPAVTKAYELAERYNLVPPVGHSVTLAVLEDYERLRQQHPDPVAAMQAFYNPNKQYFEEE